MFNILQTERGSLAFALTKNVSLDFFFFTELEMYFALKWDFSLWDIVKTYVNQLRKL